MCLVMFLGVWLSLHLVSFSINVHVNCESVRTNRSAFLSAILMAVNIANCVRTIHRHHLDSVD